MSAQLAFDLDAERRNPLSCPHIIRTAYDVKPGQVVCGYRETPTWTNCHASVCGEPPRCAFELPDNSPDAVAWRLAWMSARKA